MRLAIVLTLVVPWIALAQPPAFRPDRLYVSPTYSGGASRLTAMGHAYVAIAEGIEAVPINAASLAHRAPDLRRPVAFEPIFTFSFPRGGDRDLDGVDEGAGSPVDFAMGARLLLYKLGVGALVRVESVAYCAVVTDGECSGGMQVGQADVTLGAAWTAWRDQLVLGGSYVITNGSIFTFDIARDANGLLTERDRGTAIANARGFQASALYRPEARPFRVGANFRSASAADAVVQQGDQAAFFDRPIYRGVVTPALLSAGLAWNFGDGAEHLNRLSPLGRYDYDEVSYDEAQKLDFHPEDQTGRLLVSAQVDLALPVQDAAGARQFIEDGPALPVGEAATLTPRLAVEHLTVVHRLRLRAGTYLEPSVFPGISPRLHGTGGFDLRLFHLFADWTLMAHFDVAQGEQTYGATIGLW